MHTKRVRDNSTSQDNIDTTLNTKIQEHKK